MILGVDHLVIAVADPDGAVSELAAFLGIPPGTSAGRHLAWGTRNRLLWLGDTYVELCTVFDARLAERSWLGRAVLRGLGDGASAVGWAIATDDIDLDRAQMNADGATLGRPTSGERRRPDGQVVRWRLALPPEVDLARPFLIEHDPRAAEWTEEDRVERARMPGRLVELDLPLDAIDGLPTAAAGTVYGSQLVRAVGPSAGQPAVRIGGLGRSGATASLLGCRWLVG